MLYSHGLKGFFYIHIPENDHIANVRILKPEYGNSVIIVVKSVNDQ